MTYEMLQALVNREDGRRDDLERIDILAGRLSTLRVKTNEDFWCNVTDQERLLYCLCCILYHGCYDGAYQLFQANRYDALAVMTCGLHALRLIGEGHDPVAHGVDRVLVDARSYLQARGVAFPRDFDPSRRAEFDRAEAALYADNTFFRGFIARMKEADQELLSLFDRKTTVPRSIVEWVRSNVEVFSRVLCDPAT